MNITAEEKLMYSVMKAIYESRIPIDFKGAMVLKACLLEAGYPDDIRHTVDVDANWNSETAPTPEQMTDSIEAAIRRAGIDLKVNMYRMYGDNRSAGFELKDPETDELLFSMDIDVNRPMQATKLYQIEGLRFRGISPIMMLVDKISAISTDKVFSRIKDVVDLYYLAQVFGIDRDELAEAFNSSRRTVGDFDGFLHRLPELEHAYSKYRLAGNVSKPPFEEVYGTVKRFIRDVLPRERNRDYVR